MEKVPAVPGEQRIMDIDSFLDKESKPKEQAEQKPGEEKLQTGEPESEPGDLDSLIASIRSMMTENRYEEAERLYMSAKEKYAEMARRHAEEQNRIYAQLEDINKNMLQGLSVLKESAKKNVEIIKELMSRAKERLANNELSIANQLYSQIEAQFKKLPDVIAEDKLELEQQIVQLHVDLSSKSNMAASADFNAKFNNIRNLLAFAFENVKRGNMNEAAQLYQRINTSYEQLPKGFLIEKAMLYQQILKLFKEVQHRGTGDAGKTGA